jgi:uncharacterized membrane protein YeaQ/YmgE (transglycosylase-associated protein family)
MQPISPLVRLILGAVAAGLTTVMAPDVFGILPKWAQVAVGFVGAVIAFALLPVNWNLNRSRAIAVKRRQAPTATPEQPRSRREGRVPPRAGRLMMASLLAFGALVVSPVHAVASMDVTHAEQQCHAENVQRAMLDYSWNGTVYMSGWWPRNSRSGTVQIDYYSGDAYTVHLYRRRFQCTYTGDNAGWGLMNISFRFIWPQGYPVTEQLR